MIDQLRAMAIFQAVAEAGSFRQAAAKLRLSPSVVSHHITQFEARLGTPLLYRSTRRISLTEAGTDLLRASQQMSRAAQEGLAAINRRVSQPQGRLSITVNTSAANRPVCDIYTGFAKAYPNIQLSMHINDRQVSLEGSPYDLAIRGTTNGLDDSSYKATRLGSLKFCIFASPEYVNARPPVRSLDDLTNWDWVQTPQIAWSSFAGMCGLAPTKKEPRIAVSCDNFEMGMQFVRAGLGFCAEFKLLVAADLKSGELVEVLPGAFSKSLDVFAVYPANAPDDSPARLFVEYMLDQSWILEGGYFSRD
ncbi:MAG: hypothetical protein COB65_09655 [Thalassobium sp.]|uniref:LysR family transcriptional regulator n=1 Tax=Octadecabacter sp. SW4 TaxID=2602067 RepID=UPI000C0FC1C5|nr:LysR family transcriptional regulator [Octadecabacter sp. SW4]PHQ81913.1 MAG: hypothetical protein COB65_09655 [Thalassobium sp.]QEE36147.1 LysR family transcriptional regulator [Octadecabacter sp. SW4]